MKKRWILFYVFMLALIIFTSCNAKKESIQKIDLGYGDYIENLDDTYSLEDAYQNLQKKVTSSVSGIFQSNYQQGALDFFNLDNKVKLQLELKEKTVEALDEAYLLGDKESYHRCNINIIFNHLKFHYENIGIRQKGNSSRRNILTQDGKINLCHYKLSFSEAFDDELQQNLEKNNDVDALQYRENRSFFGLEKFNLRWNRNHDGTYLKEYYANEIYRNNGVLAPHCNLLQMEMVLENQIENLGVYLVVEDINKDFIKSNVVEECAKGDLYKLGWTDVGARLDSTESSLFGVEYQIEENDHFKVIGYPYDLKTNKKTSHHEAIFQFIDGINQTSSKDFYNFLKKSSIYDSVISYFAVSYLLGDPDDLRGNFNNTYLYFTKNQNLALMIPTDQDRALGSTGGTGNPTKHYGALSGPFDLQTGYSLNDMPLYEKSILEGGNQQIQKDYLAKIAKIIDASWLDFNIFEDYYHKALKYESDVVLGKRIQDEDILFTLNEETNLNAESNLSIEVYLKTKKKTFLDRNWVDEIIDEVDYSNYYLRGQMNQWNGIEKKYQLRIVNNHPTLECYLDKGQSFKIASKDWKEEWNYTDLADKSGFLSEGDEQNIKPLESGKYLIEIIDGILRITKE